MLDVDRVNTVLYCDRWTETVAFYRDLLGLAVAFENDWFVEFEVTADSFLSIADAARATVGAGDGRGITLSWRVADVAAARAAMIGAGVDAGPVRARFGSPVVDLYDPSGNRIELWS